jgi:hypothetical protein
MSKALDDLKKASSLGHPDAAVLLRQISSYAVEAASQNLRATATRRDTCTPVTVTQI